MYPVPGEPRPSQRPACGAETVARIIWGLVAGPVPGKEEVEHVLARMV